MIERVYNEAEYILNTNDTIRATAKKFNVSKSTVHKDLSQRLIDIDYDLYINICSIMKEHINIRHIKGGESTKNKYKKELSY